MTAANKVRWTVDDLESLPETSDRFEIIDGDLHVTRAPHWKHQDVAGTIYAERLAWSKQTQLGKPVFTPGVFFSPSDAVIPDVVWASDERIETLIDEAGHFTDAPELVIEVLSKSPQDKKRDKESKLKLYSVEGVQEYWIFDREQQMAEVFRREDGVLIKVLTLYARDTLTSALLPDFSCDVASLFD
ncbi:MAG: Uma2 family endonuclease [Leptolyngbyaceae cyanobacterium MAG.088]|nr:Uma2 family endonuclease [Leptolyngbyaceae cyanobacterium MAG.088]